MSFGLPEEKLASIKLIQLYRIKIQGYIDISPRDFKEVFQIAYNQAVDIEGRPIGIVTRINLVQSFCVIR